MKDLVWMVNTSNPMHVVVWLVWTLIVHSLAVVGLVFIISMFKIA